MIAHKKITITTVKYGAISLQEILGYYTSLKENLNWAKKEIESGENIYLKL